MNRNLSEGLSLWVIVFVLFVVACSPIGDAASGPIRIGGVFHLTGPASYWGQGERDAVLLAVEEMNAKGGVGGRPVYLIIEDGKTDFTQTATAINRLVDVDKVSVIIGPTWFGQVAAPIAESSNVTILSPSTGVTLARRKFFFNLWPAEQQEILPLVDYMARENRTRVAVVFSQNDWSASMKDTFVKEAGSRGIEIVETFASSPDESDFRSIISKLNLLRIDSVYAPFAFYPSQGAFSKQAREMNLPVPIFSSSGTENPDMLKSYPEIEGTIYPYPVPGPGESDFTKNFEVRYGHPPSPSAAYAYDAANLVISALRSGAMSSESTASYLSSVKGFHGVTNDIFFDPSTGRIVEKEHRLKVVHDGRFIQLD